MTKQELIKQAYAYGAAVALQELGYNTQQAQATGVKLAEDGEGMHPAIAALLGGGAGALGGAALGAGSAFIPGLRGKGLTGLMAGRKGVPSAIRQTDALRGIQGRLSGGLEEAYLRGLGGSGVGALGGAGLAGGLAMGE